MARLLLKEIDNKNNKAGTRMKFSVAVSVLFSFNAFSSELASLEKINVFGQNPLFSEHSTTSIIGSIQSITGEDLRESNVISLSQHMKNRLSSVHINDVQNNSFQPDVQYRGFTASPLLGMAQGISVYLNGVRFNEPFGDTVNWDLIPLAALDNVALYSGSNPSFGQNTLGGALNMRVKNGFTHTENALGLQLGSFGQKQLTLQSGGNNGRWGYYVLVNRLHEDGWRDFSSSDLNQFLSTLTYQGDTHHMEMMLSANGNELTGNGAVPQALQAVEGNSAIYTYPDKTKNAYRMLAVNTESTLGKGFTLQANSYFRRNYIDTTNGDDSDFQACEFDNLVTLCEEEDNSLARLEFVGYAPDAFFSDISDIDANSIDGTLNQSATQNKSYGLALQLLYNKSTAAIEHQWVFGGGIDQADIDFASDTQFGILHNSTPDDDRSVSATGFFDSGSQVRLGVKTYEHYLYAAYSARIDTRWLLSAAGRFNDSKISMHDRIDVGEGSLNGEHEFNRFNPAMGLQYILSPHWSLSVSYSESSRMPSPAELSCADENDPCKLPNGFVADPPLNKVVAKTLETSVDYQADSNTFSATLYRTKSTDDIIFQQAGVTQSEGYFINVDATNRQGVELSFSHDRQTFSLGASYSYLDATFESPFVSFSPNNPFGGDRQVQVGSAIPGLPKHQLKMHSSWDINEAVSAGAEWLFASSSFYRGDEANEHKKVPAYSVLNMYVNYQFNQTTMLSARIDNAFDRQYHTFGTYGEPEEVLGEVHSQIDEPYFIGPASPRSVSVNMQVQF
ncbi:MAG: iron complex outermembrane receptor protein [Paraglaciecola sp.]